MCTHRNNVPWQSNKTVRECNKYMLEKELYSDVTFLVGNENTGVREIKAHRYVLVSRSPVFEAMLCGDLRENGQIKIPDTDWKTFQLFLRYLYYEEFPSDPCDLVPLLYHADKYLIPKLESECEKELKQQVNIENVCCILEQSLLFQRPDLIGICMEIIINNFKDILQQKDFLYISQNTLKHILEIDILSFTEPEVFEMCVTWGKYQCDVIGITQTGENIRRVLGDALYGIRFPVMWSDYLAKSVAPLNILTASEMPDAESDTKNKTPFKSEPRRRSRDMLFCERFKTVYTALRPQRGSADAIAFLTDNDIHVYGIKVYLSGKSSHTYSIEVTLYQGQTSLESIKYEGTGSSKIKDIYFKKPICIKMNMEYDVVARIKGEDCYFGWEGRKEVVQHGVKFNFKTSKRDFNSTNVKKGQIPCIIWN